MKGLVGGIIGLFVKILPPTIHPMVVHFPIALLYVTALVDVLAVLQGPRRDRFWDRAGFWALTLSLMSIVAAGAAGMVSEQSVKWTPQTASILSQHQHDAFFTGFFALIAWVLQWLRRFRRDGGGNRWSILRTGRGRVSWAVALFVVAATVMVSITGSLGGSMVYNHGVHPTRNLQSLGTSANSQASAH